MKYYKLKFFNNQIGGNNETIGINYEAGKIIDHILKYPKCVAFANIQIAMDAPYHNREAPESVRKEGRSEKSFPCYNEKYLLLQLEKIFLFIKEKYPDTKIIIQIARGRAAEWTIKEILDPLLLNLNIKNYEYNTGYRTDNYYKPQSSDNFVFVNYGMFAVLRNVENVEVAEVCNPNKAFITNYDDKLKIFESNFNVELYDDDKNILNKLPFFQKITLIGISDHNPFITKDVYPRESINILIDKINKIL
jgi:hypothetical protein